MISSAVKSNWNWNFADFRDLGKTLPEAAKGGSLKNLEIFTIKHLCHSLFLSCNFIQKETLAQGFSFEFYKIFKNNLFMEHLWMTASVLQQLLALYFSIIYSWQLSSSEKTLLGKKIHPFISRVLQIHISFTQMLFSFSLTNAWLTCPLRKSYAVLWAGNHFVGSESPIDNTFDQFWKFKFYFE